MEEAGNINYNILKGKTTDNGKISIILKIWASMNDPYFLIMPIFFKLNNDDNINYEKYYRQFYQFFEN